MHLPCLAYNSHNLRGGRAGIIGMLSVVRIHHWRTMNIVVVLDAYGSYIVMEMLRLLLPSW